jgi:hypothetical protein
MGELASVESLMTHDEIIEMARQAGFSIDDLYPNASIQEIERFAILVASFTWREQALSEVQKVGQVIEEIQAAVLAEREACAKVCEEDAFVEQWKGLAEATKRIRARGQA